MDLIKPFDIKRYQEFKKDVDDLIWFGYIRHYSSEISSKINEDRANVVKYYKGKVPIGDNFLKRFKKAYAKDLKRIREQVDPSEPPIAPDTQRPKLQSWHSDSPPNTTTPLSPIRQPEGQFPSDFQKAMMKKMDSMEIVIKKLQQEIKRLEKKIDERSNNS